MDTNLFFNEKFKKPINEFNFDLNNEKKYIFYNEKINKTGKRYNEIINNNIDINEYNTHSPSCIKIYDVISDLNINNNDTIIDIGSGKGFALFIFSLFNFKKILGIEISTKDHNICLDNIQKINSKNIELINDDILNFDNFNDFNYFYFYNPFEPKFFETIITKIISQNKEFKIIYKNIHEDEKNILNKLKFIFIKKYDGIDRDYYVYSYKK